MFHIPLKYFNYCLSKIIIRRFTTELVIKKIEIWDYYYWPNKFEYSSEVWQVEQRRRRIAFDYWYILPNPHILNSKLWSEEEKLRKADIFKKSQAEVFLYNFLLNVFSSYLNEFKFSVQAPLPSLFNIRLQFSFYQNTFIFFSAKRRKDLQINSNLIQLFDRSLMLRDSVLKLFPDTSFDEMPLSKDFFLEEVSIFDFLYARRYCETSPMADEELYGEFVYSFLVDADSPAEIKDEVVSAEPAVDPNIVAGLTDLSQKEGGFLDRIFEYYEAVNQGLFDFSNFIKFTKFQVDYDSLIDAYRRLSLDDKFILDKFKNFFLDLSVSNIKDYQTAALRREAYFSENGLDLDFDDYDDETRALLEEVMRTYTFIEFALEEELDLFRDSIFIESNWLSVVEASRKNFNFFSERKWLLDNYKDFSSKLKVFDFDNSWIMLFRSIFKEILEPKSFYGLSYQNWLNSFFNRSLSKNFFLDFSDIFLLRSCFVSVQELISKGERVNKRKLITFFEDRDILDVFRFNIGFSRSHLIAKLNSLKEKGRVRALRSYNKMLIKLFFLSTLDDCFGAYESCWVWTSITNLEETEIGLNFDVLNYLLFFRQMSRGLRYNFKRFHMFDKAFFLNKTSPRVLRYSTAFLVNNISQHLEFSNGLTFFGGDCLFFKFYFFIYKATIGLTVFNDS